VAPAWFGVRRSSGTAKGQRRLIVASQTGNPSGADPDARFIFDMPAPILHVG
jgi:hypothetical protein